MIHRVCESCLCSVAATAVGWAWPVVSKGVCLHVRKCFCVYVEDGGRRGRRGREKTQKGEGEREKFLKAKNWHFAHRVGWGKNIVALCSAVTESGVWVQNVCVYVSVPKDCVCVAFLGVCVCYWCLNSDSSTRKRWTAKSTKEPAKLLLLRPGGGDVWKSSGM